MKNLPSSSSSSFACFFDEDEAAFDLAAALDEPAQLTSITVAKQANISMIIQNKLLTFILRRLFHNNLKKTKSLN